MRFTKPLWLSHGGDKKDFEVYSCHVSPDGSRLVTAAGGEPSRTSKRYRSVALILLQMVMYASGQQKQY